MVAKLYTFQESLDYLLSLGNEVSAMKLGLENIRRLLVELGDPQDNYIKVQVAGTNGKGSVCAFLDSICNTAGIKTGTFTSPHLVSITERIRINGADISEDDLARHATFVRETAESLLGKGELEYRPTFFEQITAIGLVAFAEAKVDVAILETGLGGRLDATTAANAEIAVITRIDFDHQEYLGETIEEITAEKAAIITAETRDVILGDQSREVMRLLRKHCSDLGIEPLNDEYEPWRTLSNGDGTVKVGMSLIDFPPIRLGLKGKHQIENAQTALQAARALLYHGRFLDCESDEEEVRILEGLQNAWHPGRLEFRGQYLFDGAHNIGGAIALRDFLDETGDNPITMIFGAMKDKNVAAILEILLPKAERLILTKPANQRALTAEQIVRLLPNNYDRERVILTETAAEAFEKANEFNNDGIILVTGSLYLVGEISALTKAIHK
ncbi:MAG: folylpolyglutamate synthase/dihydrofolate synthase family protein [Acidobacteriota bacterium]